MKSCFILACLLAVQDAASPAAVTDFVLADAQGKKHTRAEWKDKKAVVLLFLGTDCPVSNFYCPDYVRLAARFSGKGVLFFGIYPDPYVTAADAAEHAAKYRLLFPVLLDPTHAVIRQTMIKVVPEAVVLSGKGHILYRGRIDDRYTANGIRREVPTTRDLEEALAAVVDGKKPAVAETKAFGCPLPEPARPVK